MTVPSLSVTFMGFTAFLCIATPFIFWLVVREKVQFRQALMGLVVYFVFVILLKGQVDSIVLVEGSSLMTNKLQYVLYVVLVSAIFEEISKFCFFKFYLKNKFQRADAAVGFGIGFAAYASIYVGIMAISNFALALTLNEYGIENVIQDSSPENANQLMAILEGMCNANSTGFLMEGVSKFFFIVQQMAMSVIVWYAATRDDSAYLLPGAVVLHGVFMVPTALYQFDNGYGMVTTELIYCGMIAMVAVFAYWLYKKKEPKTYDFRPDRLKARKRG